MNFDYSDRTRDMLARVRAFMDKHVYPNEARFDEEVATGDRWQPVKLLEELKPLARTEGLWNMFVPPSHGGVPVNEFHFEGTPLTNLEYAPLAEEMGRVVWASEVFNCSAPDTGNQEVLARLRHRRAAAEMAGAAVERRDPFGLPDDRAGGRLVPTRPISRPRSGARATNM